MSTGRLFLSGKTKTLRSGVVGSHLGPEFTPVASDCRKKANQRLSQLLQGNSDFLSRHNAYPGVSVLLELQMWSIHKTFWELFDAIERIFYFWVAAAYDCESSKCDFLKTESRSLGRTITAESTMTNKDGRSGSASKQQPTIQFPSFFLVLPANSSQCMQFSFITWQPSLSLSRKGIRICGIKVLTVLMNKQRLVLQNW